MTELGLYPILFEIGDYKIMSYNLFILLAFLAGFLIYKKDAEKNIHSLGIVLSGLTGGALGAKLAMLLVYFGELQQSGSFIGLLYSGKSIVGGLIGGSIGVMLYKRVFKIKVRLGNKIAVPVLVGMAVGRIGCLLNGCCYGKETDFFLAFNFRNGSHRHPTQIYEIIFDLGLAFILSRMLKKNEDLKPGKLYQVFINSYLTFRFFLEFIRDEKVVFYYLTYFQLICIVGVLLINLMRRKDNKLYEG